MSCRLFEPVSLTARRTIWLSALALISVLLSELVFSSAMLESLEQRVQDVWFQWQGKQQEPKHVVIVEIDESTLAAYPDEPMVFWTGKFANASHMLRQMKAGPIGLDMLFSISPERWFDKLGGQFQQAARDFDQALRIEINSGQLILAGSRHGKGALPSDYLLPSPDYLLALPDFDVARYVGLTDLVSETDGVVRRFDVSPSGGQHSASVLEGFPSIGFPTLLALHATGQNTSASQWSLANQTVSRDMGKQLIPFIGPTGSFPAVSLQTLLNADVHDPALNRLFKDKVILIGLASGLGDDHHTPFTSRMLSGRGGLMSGVEVHANVVESLLQGRRLEKLKTVTRLLLTLGVSLVAVYGFARFSASIGVAIGCCTVLLTLVLAYHAFLYGTLVPVVHLILSVTLAWLLVMLWRLQGEEKQRLRLRQLFSRYVSDQVVTELLRSEARPELGGTSQIITVLFSDIRNFTTISEKLSAKEVVEMLNTYFEKACQVMQAHGGSIDKFIGDAIMVEFGAPLSVRDHALQAVKAALDLAALAAEFAQWMAQRFPDRDLPPFVVGIGLHSGEAVVGNIGASFRMDYTAIGDTVNLASRLEGATKNLGCVILASEATVKDIKNGLILGKSDLIHVKGRLEPVSVYEVLALNKGNVYAV